MKNPKKTLLAMAAGTLLLASTVGTSFAKGGHGMGGFGGGPGMGGFGMGGGKGLGICNPYNPSLTQEQRQKLLELREAYLKDVTPFENQLMTKKLELRNLWAAQSPDQEKITQKQQEILSLQQKIQERATKYRLDCQQVLNSALPSGN